VSKPARLDKLEIVDLDATFDEHEGLLDQRDTKSAENIGALSLKTTYLTNYSTIPDASA
jgi:hypothetical protein